MDMQEAAKDKQSRSHSKFEDKSDPGLSIDLDLPGVDVQIDTNGIKIDAQGMKSIIYTVYKCPQVIVASSKRI